jgi:hypothetical protein
MKQVQAYHAIRLAMMGGVLLFGAVAWFATRTEAWMPPASDVLATLTTVGRITWAIAVCGIIVLFSRHRNTESPVTRSSVAIIAWAVGEALALFGAVFLYLTGQPMWYVFGILAISLTFVAFPPPALR